MKMITNREFDLVLLGSTGYTGKLTAEHIVQSFPTNLKWALAGRSATKVQALANELRSLNPDRHDPEIVGLQLKTEELEPLARRTRVIINCVGPYRLHSTPVVEACANNGTHYVDATGETPWIREMIDTYHETAKTNGAIMIPSTAFESAPPDILTWSLVDYVRKTLSAHPVEVIGSMHKIKSSGTSGGTQNTLLSIMDSYSISDLFKFADPYQLAASPPPPTRAIPRRSLADVILGVRSVPHLGSLTTSPSGISDEAIVYRSSTLLSDFYGPAFHYRQYLHVPNSIVGIAFHYAFTIGVALFLLPPIRWLGRKYALAPGSGPTKESSINDYAEFRAVATTDQKQDDGRLKQAVGSISFHGSVYRLTAVAMSEAARTILEHEEELKHNVGAGILTTATLGQHYVDRLEEGGFRLETRLVND